MRTCRSIRYTSKEKIDLIEIPITDPKPDEVQVQKLACGVCAWDLFLYRNGDDGSGFPGHEGVGRVIKVGSNVKTINEGDCVCGGALGFAEFQNELASRLHILPKAAEQNASDWIVEPVACIVTGLDHCHLLAGQRLAVVGCGFMGLMFIQALSHSLLDQLIAIDVNPKRLQKAREFGATEALDPSQVDPKQLKERGIDTVVDCSGNQKALDFSSRILRSGGRLNLFGWNHGAATIPSDLWHMHGFTVINSSPGSAIRDTWPTAIRLLERKHIHLRPLISDVVKLNEYPDLLRKTVASPGEYMKGVVRLS